MSTRVLAGYQLVMVNATDAVVATGPAVKTGEQIYRQTSQKLSFVVEESGGTKSELQMAVGIQPYTDSSGTPGAATINKLAGRSAIAAGAASAVITNSNVAATDIVLAVLETRDATGVDLVIVPGAGSFTASVAANATGTTKFSWIVQKTV